MSTGKFNTLDDIISATRKGTCRFFFDKDTMRSFGCRVSTSVYPAADASVIFFVTSERDPYSSEPRTYTVRRAHPDGDIRNVSGFGEYRSASGAHNRARKERGTYNYISSGDKAETGKS